MSRNQFFVRYALPYILGLMCGGLAMKAVQQAGGGENLAFAAWLCVTAAFIVAWVMIKRALAGRTRSSAHTGC